MRDLKELIEVLKKLLKEEKKVNVQSFPDRRYNPTKQTYTTTTN